MNSLDSIQHYFVLLFWYIGERNWTVQSTSTIVKPRKEADEYQPGDIVIAKFQGKPYRAIIVRIEDDKEALAEDRVRFDKLLHDASLSPSQILEQMGIAADLDAENDDAKTTTKRPESSQTKKASAKRPANQQKKSLPKDKKAKTQSSSTMDNIKMVDKQKKIATLESSKLMAARLLQGTKTDKELQPLKSSSVNVSTASSTPTTVSFTASYTQPPSSLQHLSVSSATSLPQLSTQNQVTTSPSVPYAHNYSVSVPSAVSISASSCIPHYPPSQTQETLTGTHIPFQQNMLSSIHSPSQISLPTDNLYQHSGNLYDWDYSGSASELIANSFTNEDASGLTPPLDCSKCMPLIHTLTQRINSLEEKVESIIAANKHTNKHPTAAAAHTDPSSYNTAPSSCTAPSSYTASRTPQTSRSATPNQSLSPMADQTTVVKPACTDNEDGSMTCELLPGYGVKITVPQLDACLRKSKGSGTALARLLVNVYFDDKTLAESSVKGTKSKPALDSTIITAIINYVCSKRNLAEKDVVQALNQKCADARASIAASCKKK